MRHLCVIKVMVSFLLISASFLYAEEKPRCVSFYYGSKVPMELLLSYDWVVVDPDTASDVLKSTEKIYAQIFAYVSVGEIEPYRSYYKLTRPEWVIGENKAWKTKIADISNSEYREFLLSYVIKGLAERGFKNFFLDTLDSYQMVFKDEIRRKAYEENLLLFIQELKNRYPQTKIITNRGFEIIDKVYPFINGFALESLFSGLDLRDKSYKNVSEEERKQLLENLERVKKYNIPIIIIDYVEPSNRKKAKQIAHKIKNLGFIPWVTDKHLETIGIGGCEIKRRRILLLYDGKSVEDIRYSNAHRLASMPLEYMGYIPEVYDIKNGLPEGYLIDRYAGIIIWLQSLSLEVEMYNDFFKWVLEKIEEGNKILFLGSFGFPFEARYMERLGIDVFPNKAGPLDKIEILKKESFVGFETEPDITYISNLIKVKEGKPIIIAKNSKGKLFHPIAVTPWGGYAVEGSFLVISLESLWAVDPFEFFRISLELEYFPSPDITTESGKRLLFVHIDADGFASKAEFKPQTFGTEIIRDEILKTYKIPHSVSIIEGETAPHGIYPEISSKLEEIAKSIFSLDNVEIASHSFSHPYKWQALHKGEEKPGYNLPIKDYKFNLEREIKGSVEYINKLAPKGKTVKAFFWTGDCEPPKEAIALTYKLGLLNINGGDTDVTNEFPWLSRISPAGLLIDGYLQVYASQQNENVYTNNWSYPFYRYVNVIQTFELTDKPKRLKPINIYYHMFSGTKIASLNALHKVYKWALSQEVLPIYTSEYIKKVIDFYNIAIAFDGLGWIVRGNGELKTLRIPKDIGYPDLEKSKGVTGYSDHEDVRYIHLDNSGKYYLVTTGKQPQITIKTN